MSIHLYLAPPATGKTHHLLELLREEAADLSQSPRLVVSTPLQRQAVQRRLAARGGALGAHILTMNGLGSSLLDTAGLALTRLVDPVIVRLLRVALDRAHLQFYAPLRTSPGLAQQMRRLFGELQKNNVSPPQLTQTVAAEPPALQELARIYQSYITLLQQHQASDGPGWVGRVTTVLQAHPQAIPRWRWLAFDGFDRFTPAEIELITLLSRYVHTLIITLTGAEPDARTAILYQQAQETRESLEAALEVEAEPLPTAQPQQEPALHFLATNIFRHQSASPHPAPMVELIAAADMQQEVREALRWLKMRIVQDGMATSDVALLARTLAPYQPSIRQVAAEMGLPLYIPGGLPLRQNPAIAALLDLLSLPAPDPQHEQAFAFRPLLNTWRSPYFNWQAYVGEDDDSSPAAPLNANALDRVGRWGRVLAGWAQWEETLRLLMAVSPDPTDDDDDPAAFHLSATLPRGEAVRNLWQQFQTFSATITPPAGRQPLAVFVRWLEDLIGPDPDLDSQPSADDTPSLQMPQCIRTQKDVSLRERDLAALQALKDVLRGMVSAAAMVAQPPIDYASFLNDLQGSIEAAHYEPAPDLAGPHILAADVVQAKGLSFRAVAVVGLAEGAFPSSVREDSLLPDRDRARLHTAGIPIEPSLRSEEASIFHQAITRSRERLLLTRPRLAEGGAVWPESPYWQEVLRWLQKPMVRQLHHNEPVPPSKAASWAEVMQIYAREQEVGWKQWLAAAQPQRWQRLHHGVQVAQQRLRRQAAAHDGNLQAYQQALHPFFAARRIWSASQLETYLQCPYFWFSRHALHLEPRPDPSLGPDPAQLGTIYHELLKRIFAEADDPTDIDSLLDKLAQIAETELQQAPQKLGFRPPAWWRHTQDSIIGTLENTLRQLVAQSRGWKPWAFEQEFGRGKHPPLVVSAQGKTVLVRGIIDRVDVNGHNQVRVIDYKSGNVSGHKPAKLASGELLQLPLYALAVEQSLEAGRVIDGFYWSITAAKTSPLRLSSAASKPDLDARSVAQQHTVEAVTQMHEGAFTPRPPRDGCPPYCPAADFCWHYRAGRW